MSRGRLCRECRAKLPADPTKLRCTMCGFSNVPDVELSNRLVRLTDAKVSSIRRYDVGMYNRIFGGGIATTSVSLIAGPPGAGKTTMFCNLCDMVLDLFPEKDDVVLFIGNEQPPEEIRMYAERIGVKNGDRIVILNAIGGVEPGEIAGAVRKLKPKLGILDSLTNLVDLAGGGDDFGVLIVNEFKKLSSETDTPWLIVNQVTKGGQHAGLNKTLHAGGALFYLDKDDVTGERLLYVEKNRFGPAPQEVHLRMIPEGMPNAGKLVLDAEWYMQNDEDGEWWRSYAPVRDTSRGKHVEKTDEPAPSPPDSDGEPFEAEAADADGSEAIDADESDDEDEGNVTEDDATDDGLF